MDSRFNIPLAMVWANPRLNKNGRPTTKGIKMGPAMLKNLSTTKGPCQTWLGGILVATSAGVHSSVPALHKTNETLPEFQNSEILANT